MSTSHQVTIFSPPEEVDYFTLPPWFFSIGDISSLPEDLQLQGETATSVIGEVNSAWENLTGDLIREILLRLPVTSLMQFRCVSKSWCSLITSPDFIRKQLEHSNVKYHSEGGNKTRIVILKFQSNVCHLVLLDENTFKSSCNRNIPQFQSCQRSYDLEIVGSCNGLLCFTDLLKRFEPESGSTFLVNPCINHLIKIPNPSYTLPVTGELSYLGMSASGFGYVEATDDYKFMMFDFWTTVPHCSPFKALVQIYSLKTNSWKFIQVSSIEFIPPWKLTIIAVYFNGFLHLFAVGYEWYSEGHEQEFLPRILTFDIGDELFGQLPIPEAIFANATEKMITECTEMAVVQDLLALLINQGKTLEHNAQICIWVMKKYGVPASWTKQFNVVLQEDITRTLAYIGDGKILCAAYSSRMEWWESEYFGDADEYKHFREKLIIYDLENSKYYDPGEPAPQTRFHAATFRESLLLLDNLQDSTL